MDDSRSSFYYLGVSDYRISLKLGTNNPTSEMSWKQILQGSFEEGALWRIMELHKLKNKTRETMELVSWQVIMRGHFQSPLVTWQTSIRCKVTTYIFIHVWDRLRINIQGTSKNLSSKFTSLAGKDRFLQRFQRFAPETVKKTCLFLWFLSPATVGVIAYIGVWSNDQWLTYATKIDQNCYFQIFQHVNSWENRHDAIFHVPPFRRVSTNFFRNSRFSAWADGMFGAKF